MVGISLLIFRQTYLSFKYCLLKIKDKHMKPIITRIWHGTTRAEHADIYLDYLEKSGIPDYKNIDGNLSAEVWRQITGDICHFWTVTKWDSYNSIKKFAGKNYEKARYYPDDKDYLLDFEEQVEHYETFEY